MIRRTIHERSFVKDSHGTLTNGRSSKRWTRGRSFYERPSVNEVELHKKVNPNVHTQYKECDSIQGTRFNTKCVRLDAKLISLYEIRQNLQFLSWYTITQVSKATVCRVLQN